MTARAGGQLGEVPQRRGSALRDWHGSILNRYYRLPIFARAAMLSLVLLVSLAASAPPKGRYFVIDVVDEQTGRGVPLVELRTTHQVRYVTDSNGIAALDEPGWEGQEVFFFVSSPGYEFPADSFGYRGTRLKVVSGKTARIKLKRVNLAERLYRITGEGIYRDSILAGLPVPPEKPLLNAQVVGQDTEVSAAYRGKIYWFYGDTGRLSYPLGNFHTTGATSPLPGRGFDPSHGLPLSYFTNKDGFVQGMAPFTDRGPTWIDAIVALQEGGQERLFMAYANVRQDMTPFERGLGRFNDDTHQFEKVATFDLNAPLYPRGHPFKAKHNGVEYLYFSSPYPLIRVRATATDLRDLSRYEAFTCLKEGARFDPAHPETAALDRDSAGRLRYAWKRNTSSVGPGEQENLLRAGVMKPEEALLQLQDTETGQPIFAHGGSVYWNAYRKRWVLIAAQRGGSSSFLGEIWYAEADTPVGPWVYARKVATHTKYSLYNPTQDPYFDEAGGQRIYFEGSYSYTFSGSEETATPRYDYNQLMYRLDLADPRLALPAPVSLQPEGVTEFAAPDRAAPGLIPVYRQKVGRLVIGSGESAGKGSQAAEKPLFYALPAMVEKPPPVTVPLYECVRHSDDSYAYVTDPKRCPPGYTINESPICRVWKNPCLVSLKDETVTPIPIVPS